MIRPALARLLLCLGLLFPILAHAQVPTGSHAVQMQVTVDIGGVRYRKGDIAILTDDIGGPLVTSGRAISTDNPVWVPTPVTTPPASVTGTNNGLGTQFTLGTGLSIGSNGALNAAGKPITMGVSGAQTLQWGVTYDLTLLANTTLTMAAAPAGAEWTTRVIIRQSGAGGFVATLPVTAKWPGGTAPTPNTTAAGIDMFTFRTPDAGATIFGGG